MGVEVDGFEALEDKFERLQERGDGDAVYVVGTNVEYAVVLEFGRGPIRAQDADALRFKNDDGEIIYRTSVSGHPPYPFFRPALWEFKRDPEEFILDETDYASIDEIPTANELVQAIAFSLERQMTKNASAQRASDRSPGTHPGHPERDSGNLAASISAKRVK